MAYIFDGAGDYITINKGTTATDLSQISYSWRSYMDTGTTGYREVFWSGGSFNANFHTFVQHDTNNTDFAFMANWGTTDGRWHITRDSVDTWTNHVITYDFGATTNDPIWYRNGVSQSVTEIGTPAGTAGHTADDGTLTIGAYDDGSTEYWLGRIAELAIWNRLLTAAEAEILGDGFSPLFIPNGLVYYTPLIRNVSDLKSGNSGTITNALVTPHPRIIYPANYNIAPFTAAAAGNTYPGYYGYGQNF